MKLTYSSEKVASLCTNRESARKFFGGNTQLAVSLLARINALENADTIKDIIVQPPFRFHNLKKMYGRDGYFAIDVKSRKDPWRIIIQPLNEKEQPYDPCNIDEIAERVRIIKITEVSKHYE